MMNHACQEFHPAIHSDYFWVVRSPYGEILGAFYEKGKMLRHFPGVVFHEECSIPLQNRSLAFDPIYRIHVAIFTRPDQFRNESQNPISTLAECFSLRFSQETSADFIAAYDGDGDVDAAQRFVRTIVPAGVVWYDGMSFNRHLVSYYHGDIRGNGEYSLQFFTAAKAIVCAGANLYEKVMETFSGDIQ